MGGKKRKQNEKSKSKTKGKKTTASGPTPEVNSGDWISMLAKKTAAETSSGDGAMVLSKAERIERRKAKKRRREERKPASLKTTQKLNANEEDSVDESSSRQRKMNHKSQVYLQWLAEQLFLISEEQAGRQKPYEDPEALKRGKATSGSGKYDEDMVQPRKRDYGGLGFARPSMFLSLRDPSFIPKLEDEFAEHIPGFFGKQRTKAMKRQLDGNMLWRKLAEKRSDNRKIDGKKLSDMGPDERVEAMIKAGMI
jgi:hypothetical protein